ncbi:MAG: hypothetical protein K5769_02090 [Pseudobutyrivibrio sp.]|nr:hypothetical protein [Pseudobutyrivibrio sp.]
MNKKLLVLALVGAMILSMVACGGDDTKVIDSTGSGSNASGSANAGAGYVFKYDGMEIAVDADAAPIVDKLGEPQKYFESPSCAADGIGKLYTYSDFEIQTYPDGDKDLILYVALRTDNVSTAEGINLSSTKDDVIAAYGDSGEDVGGSLKYTKNGTELNFIFDGDSLTSIQYIVEGK